ncbi:alpha/beta hydrolase fold protein [Natrialba chahannaoensis JCM 10990]|uniref:Alpha/beta hydrolase fold protein n=2 Tax=Natrialba chahannaoensis TaxID=68911 RepID=M0AWU4_9EURY|nr:alpha/beta hydrolase fold protein [Natrialba chahannaoensis JCM 10990]
MLTDRTLFAEQLDALSSEYRAIAYDLRARTDLYNEPYDLDDLADDLAALREALDINSFVLVGISMGGFMALRFADRYPEYLKGLVLINSMAEPHTDAEREEYRQLAETVLEDGMQSNTVLQISVEKMFSDTTRSTKPAVVDSWVNRWKTYPAKSVYYAMQSWIDRSDFTPKLRTVTVPVLSIHGEGNNVLSPDRTTSMIDKLPHAHQTLLPSAGHSAPVEQPDAVTTALTTFLSETLSQQHTSDFSEW